MNSYLEGNNTDPFKNLAVEETLFETMNRPGTTMDGVCLYLWQNRSTVVIGRNQNAWKECRVPLLEQEGGVLARRMSGGGAVYHDLGNLNFSLIVPKAMYDVPRQLAVLAEAVRSFGAEAMVSGRNDVTLLPGGEKFSGNAFRIGEYACLHHGTIMIDVDMERLSRYLAPSEEKLNAKGVKSVRARVANLAAHCPGLTAEAMKAALREAFRCSYGPTQEMTETEIDQDRVNQLTERNASWDWCFGKTPAFDLRVGHRFLFGEVELLLHVRNGRLDAVKLYTDSLECSLSETVAKLLMDAPYSAEAMRERLKSAASQQAVAMGDWIGTLEL